MMLPPPYMFLYYMTYNLRHLPVPVMSSSLLLLTVPSSLSCWGSCIVHLESYWPGPHVQLEWLTNQYPNILRLICIICSPFQLLLLQRSCLQRSCFCKACFTWENVSHEQQTLKCLFLSSKPHLQNHWSNWTLVLQTTDSN